MTHSTDVSRRRVLQAAASIIPLHVGARVAAARIASGDIGAESYVGLLLKQYETHKELNVANAIDPARVLDAARAVDRARARGVKLGPAAGLPFAVKDQISVAGYPTTGGNGALKGYIPKRNAPVVERLVARPEYSRRDESGTAGRDRARRAAGERQRTARVWDRGADSHRADSRAILFVKQVSRSAVRDPS